jgi:hypothetical protein
MFSVVSGSDNGVAYVPRMNVIRSLAVSATRYDMEEDGGQKGGSVYLAQLTSGKNSNLLGWEVFRAKIPYDLFDQLKDIGLPGEFEFGATLSRRGGDRARLLVTSIIGGNLLTRARLELLAGLSGSGAAGQPSAGPAAPLDGRPGAAKPGVVQPGAGA